MQLRDQDRLKDIYLNTDFDSFRNGFMRNFTYSNVSALIVWLYDYVVHPNNDFFYWFRLFGVSTSIYFSAWFVEMLWWKFKGANHETPFMVEAYTERIVLSSIAGGIFFPLAMLLCRLTEPELIWPWLPLVGFSVALFVQIFIQWSQLQKLRKLSLTNL
ncbi:MAG TPA: hypothetical protein PLG25_14065 [bacterium]|nr:hypothetical protein [bacterium]